MASKKVVRLKHRGFGRIVPERGSYLKPKDAQALADVAGRLLSAGRYSLDAMVEEARKPSSPIHHLLDWNVHKAAEWAWRRQMGLLMSKVEIVVRTDHGEERVRWLHTVTTPGANDPRSFAVDVATVNEEQEIGEQLWRDALYIWERYHTFARIYPQTMHPFSKFLSAAEELREARQSRSA